MLSVGLTGNVASGKSAVASAWRDAGVPVVSADDLAREAVAPGSPGLAEVREAFGDGVLADDGTLDRAALRRRVFGDPGARKRLESILHPRIGERREAWLEERRRDGAEMVVSEIPLLFETGMEAGFDAVVFVDAPEDVRIERMVRDRDMDEAEARAVMDAQADPSEKRRRSDHVLENADSLEALRRRAVALLDTLRDPPLMALDLHMHTWGSWDCLSDPDAVLRQGLSRGLDRLALTDHDHLDVALAMAEAHPDRVIPGEEVRTAEGIDVIGLYLSEEIPKGTPAREVVERTRAQGGIPYLPHPYAPGKGGGGRLAEELAPLVDVVEVFNARLHPEGRNDPARELQERTGTLPGAGSDAHTVAEVANSRVVVPRHPSDAAALLRALRRARVQGREASRLVHLASTWAKLRRKLPGAPGPAR